MLCYRIVTPGLAARALDGEGARLFGGRWNPPGLPCVYTAGSRALAALEMLVHLTGLSRAMPFRLLTIQVPDVPASPPVPLPSTWLTTPAGNASQSVGKSWLQSRRSVVLQVPSVIIPEESNLLINPLAPGFESVRVLDDLPFQFDLRLARDG